MTRFVAPAIICCLFCTCLLTKSLAQQYLVFYNDATGQLVQIRTRDVIKLEYSGYLSQPEMLENKVIRIKQDTLVLGRTVFGYADPKTLRTVLLQDVTGFRRFSRLRYTLKTTAQIGTAVGSFFLFRQVINRRQLSGTTDVLLSLGVGIGSALLIEVLFPKRIKHHMKNGWEYRVY